MTSLGDQVSSKAFLDLAAAAPAAKFPATMAAAAATASPPAYGRMVREERRCETIGSSASSSDFTESSSRVSASVDRRDRHSAQLATCTISSAVTFDVSPSASSAIVSSLTCSPDATLATSATSAPTESRIRFTLSRHSTHSETCRDIESCSGRSRWCAGRTCFWRRC